MNWKLFSNCNMFSNYVRWMCHDETLRFHSDWTIRDDHDGNICPCLFSIVFTFIWLTRYFLILHRFVHTVALVTLVALVTCNIDVFTFFLCIQNIFAVFYLLFFSLCMLPFQFNVTHLLSFEAFMSRLYWFYCRK